MPARNRVSGVIISMFKCGEMRVDEMRYYEGWELTGVWSVGIEITE